MQIIEFRVIGIPKPQGSKRAFKHPRTNAIIMVDSCKDLKPWKESIKRSAIEAYKGEPLLGGISISVMFYMPRPRGHFRTNGELKATAPHVSITKPDIDKLARAILDALTGIIYRDDSQVCYLNVSKVYSHVGERIGVKILINTGLE